ncbi:MAG: matrixin family metalloprotease [Phycisphaerales bacterium]|nr:matrixin family metalloprotease [Phycisphaerales bacterium]
MNQKMWMAWRLPFAAGVAGLAIGSASAGDNTTTGNTEATLRMLHEAEFVTPAVETYDQVAKGIMAPAWVPLTTCFDAANPPSPDVQAAVEQFMLTTSRYQLGGRWSGVQGSPRALTWSLVPDGLSIGGGIGEPTAPSVLFSRLDTVFAAQGGRATWINRFQQVFNRWQELSGVTYTRIKVGANDWDDGAAWGSSGAAGLRGDVRISAHNIDGGSGVLAYNQFPGSGGGGDMVIDSSESWGSSSNANRFLRNTVAHENGHGLGFNHVCPISNSKLMEPFLATNFDGPQQDDIRAVQRHYGDPNEEDNNPGAATDLGTLVIPSSTVYGNVPAPVAGSVPSNAANLSIDANGEADYFKLNVAGPAIAQVTITPVGSSYVSAPQTSGCNQTTPVVDALRQANLGVSIYAGDGATLLYDATAAASGSPESIANILVSDSDGGAAFQYIRVYESDSPSQVQSYRMTVNGIATPTLTASDDAFTDKVALSWTDVTGETGYDIFRAESMTLPGTPLASVGADVATYDDITAVPGTQYYYWVKAAFAAGAPRMLAGPEAGKAQFTEPTCPADLNGDGIVDFSDYLEFLSFYDVGDLAVDFNGDGIVDFSDYLEFLTLYDAGC